MDDMFFETGADIPVISFIPRVPSRARFVLDAAAVGVTLRCPAGHRVLPPALEIIDASSGSTAIQARARCLTHRGFCGDAGIVLGGRPVRPDALDLRWVGALLHKNAVIEETGLAAAVLNHPATGVAWLANKIAPYDEQLNPGDVVLSGSFTRPTSVQRADVLHADFGRLGSISVRFV
jgi:2-oxo-hept-3-ene-1,7-dioate hydratase